MRKKYVIYTVMVGQYGNVMQPLHIDSRFDYVLFSDDNHTSNIGIWQVHPIPKSTNILNRDNKRLSRYPKSHPETLLSEYEASLYIDANLQIVDQWVYNRVVELCEQRVEYAGIKMITKDQDCIYLHSLDMCLLHAEHDYNAIIEMHALYLAGFPEHFGLNENNIIFRMHTDRMREVDQEWWWWIAHYSYRDQFSYMYCLWKFGIECQYFLPEGEDSHNSEHFQYVYHNELKNVAKQKWIKIGILEKIRNAIRKVDKEMSYRHWMFLLKRRFPKFWLLMWGVVYGIIMTPQIIRIIHVKAKR